MTPIGAQATSEASRGGATAVATRVSAETVVCSTCGCRLTTRDVARDVSSGGAWYHYEGQPGRDARGCAVACADAPHTL